MYSVLYEISIGVYYMNIRERGVVKSTRVRRVHRSAAAAAGRDEDRKQTTETFFVFPDLFDRVDL